MIKLY